MIRLSLRSTLGLTLVVANVGLTAVVATFAYRAAHDAMVDQAAHSAALVSQSLERELHTFLERRQQRLVGFLGSLRSLCGERNTNGSFGFEDQCLRAAVGGLHRSERATTTDLRSHEIRRVFYGERAVIEAPLPGQLAHIDARAGRGRYAMRAELGDLAVEVHFPIDDINALFQDRAGLEANGEAFLTDSMGYRLTSTTYAAPTDFPVRMAPIAGCLNGIGRTGLTTDYRGVDVISGVTPTTIAGGGCIVTDVTYDDATRPVMRLASLLAYSAVLLGLLGGAVSTLLAGLVTRPIKHLANAAETLAKGDFEATVPVRGTSEVRQLGLSLSRMAASLRDLVQREQTARVHAEAASRMKDDFLATLSHELRTPLNAILGWASILARTESDRARVSHAVQVIERNARVQSQMIEELLDVSRIATGRVRLALSDVNVLTAIDGALESVRPAAEAKSIILRHSVALDATMLRADPRRLQQIIWNLLSNAVRFTPAGGTVEVTARSVESYVEIAVADSGIGIAAEFLPHVFERFRQADSSTTRAHGGLGLGLAIVRDLVNMHGGTVTATSAGEGSGTTVAVRLPALVPREKSEALLVRSGQMPRLAGANVLVVDDDPDAREILRTILEDAGARVTTSSSASETRDLFSAMRPDLLIADIGMPDEDGYSLIMSIRDLESGARQMPAIALTAHTRPEDVEQALASGFQMHMAKPIDSHRLVASVASLVERVH